MRPGGPLRYQYSVRTIRENGCGHHGCSRSTALMASSMRETIRFVVAGDSIARSLLPFAISIDGSVIRFHPWKRRADGPLPVRAVARTAHERGRRGGRDVGTRTSPGGDRYPYAAAPFRIQASLSLPP